MALSLTKSTYCFSRGPEFSPKHLQSVAYNHLYFQLQEIQYPFLVSMDT